MLVISFAYEAQPSNDVLLWASAFALPIWAGYRAARFCGSFWISALGGVSVIVGGFLGAEFADVIGLSPAASLPISHDLPGFFGPVVT
jgi:hypothetical protein